ncbi:MAG TPA: hypothetical protein VEL76_40120 [Gemmataceae bacterium]|nr:hypothetical protein [Gemmataceae bacterium]
MLRTCARSLADLPDIIEPIGLVRLKGGRAQWWAARSRIEVDGWRLTLDKRPDHGDAFKAASMSVGMPAPMSSRGASTPSWLAKASSAGSAWLLVHH